VPATVARFLAATNPLAYAPGASVDGLSVAVHRTSVAGPGVLATCARVLAPFESRARPAGAETTPVLTFGTTGNRKIVLVVVLGRCGAALVVVVTGALSVDATRLVFGVE